MRNNPNMNTLEELYKAEEAVRNGDLDAGQVLIQASVSDKEDIRFTAVSLALKVHSSVAIPILKNGLLDKSDRVSERAFDTIAERPLYRNSEAQKLFIDVALGNIECQKELRLKVIKELGKIKHLPEAGEALQKIIRSGDSEMKEAAMSADPE